MLPHSDQIPLANAEPASLSTILEWVSNQHVTATKVEAPRTVHTREIVEWRYSAQPEKRCGAICPSMHGHRGMERSPHWLLEAVCEDDDRRDRSGYGAESLFGQAHRP